MVRIERNTEDIHVIFKCVYENSIEHYYCIADTFWDTGSTDTYICREVANRLRLKVATKPIIVTMLSGETKAYPTRCSIGLSNDDQFIDVEVKVVDGLPHPVILGMDIINECNNFLYKAKDGKKYFFIEKISDDSNIVDYLP